MMATCHDAPGGARPGDRLAEGVEHFNARRYFEAHEAWEALWRSAHGERRRRLQGLIQIAGAFVHYRRGARAGGFQRLLAAGVEKARTARGDADGLAWSRLLTDLGPWIAYARDLDPEAAFPSAPAALPTLHAAPPGAATR